MFEEMAVEETMGPKVNREIVDVRVATPADNLIHEYKGVDPIKDYELDPKQDWLVINRHGKAIMAYAPTWWSAVETSLAESPKELSEKQEVFLKIAILGKEIEVLHDRLKKEEQRRIALEVGFSELRQHLGPLLNILRKEEF